jgi:flagellar hook-basal body complex protein FliE
MTVSLATAISAYTNAAKIPGGKSAEAPSGAGTPSFGETLRQMGEDAVATLRDGERQSIAAMSGKADVAEVVTAVAAAEVTLQTVVAVRDRVIQAYQEILRMPI